MPRMAQFAQVREPPRMDGAEPKDFHGYGDARDRRIPPFLSARVHNLLINHLHFVY